MAAGADGALSRDRNSAKAHRRFASSSHRSTDLYDEMLHHHGVAIGRRHARKHLGWALDSAAATRRGADRVAEVPSQPGADGGRAGAHARRLLADAYEDFAWRAAA